MRRSVMAALFAAAVLALAVVVPIGTASPAAADIVVAPATDLVDGQVVTVTVELPAPPVGPSRLVARQCLPSLSPQSCDQESLVVAEVTGSVTVFSFPVRAIVQPVGAPAFDCRTADQFDRCGIGFLDENLVIPEIGLFLPLDFDPDGRLRPSITASPSTDLVEGQEVVVTVSDPPEALDLILMQCVPGADWNQCAFETATSVVPSGPSTEVTFRVHGRIDLMAGGVVDCRAPSNPCGIALIPNTLDLEQLAFAPLAFDQGVPPRPAASISVTPASGLTDGQLVSVAGSGFVPNGSLLISECPAGTTDFSRCQFPPTTATADANGVLVPTPYPVRLDLRSQGNVRTDCRMASCEIVVFDEIAVVEGRAAIAFAAAVPTTPTAPVVNPRFTG